MELDSFRNYTKLSILCRNISQNPTDLELLKKLKKTIHESPKSFIRAAHKALIASFYPYISKVSLEKANFSDRIKLTLVEALKELLDKLTVDNATVFFNFYSFLLLELYDYTKHKVLPVSEEHKLVVLKCMISLIRSVTSTLLEELYVKENVPKFSQIIYVCGELARNETSRDIRCTAMTCIMALAKVMDEDELTDIVLRDKCAEVFLFFLPGLSSTFTEIALEDLKVGHKVLLFAIKSYGRIIGLVMQDFNIHEGKLEIENLIKQPHQQTNMKTKWKDKNDIDLYLQTTTRNTQWYKMNDEKLNLSLKKFISLTNHSHFKVRLELVNMASEIIRTCVSTMPQSICTLIEILIILSQDEEFNISSKSIKIIENLSDQLTANKSKFIFESLEEGFYNSVNSLPRKFNSVDDTEKISALNLIIGYIKLFGKHKLNDVLLTPTILHKMIQSLIYVSELEKSNISLLEEYSLKDLNLEADFRSPWIRFRYFKDEAIKSKIENLCVELAKNNCCEVIFDSLFDTFMYDVEHRKEAAYLINAHIFGFENLDQEQQSLIQTILNAYTSHNDLVDLLNSEDYSVEEIQSNVLLICLVTEGIGKISVIMKEKFKYYLLKTLYLVLEKAGSGHPLISALGMLALNNITYSCGYSDITNLINSNFDFFSYHVERKLIRAEEKESVLNVLSVVLKYSSKDVLTPMNNIVEEVLLQSCDRFKQKYADSYLRTFEMFIVSLRRWFDIEITIEPIKSKKQKELEYENFKVSGINYNEDFSDDILEGKTAEELYREDMERKEKEQKEDNFDMEDEGYGKIEPPVHIKLTTSILKRSLHFLPSKSQTRKILVLNILEKGIEILRDWEDELLPVVHQIWSPLVERFKEEMSPLTIIYSIRLLKSLGRLSKEFIRMRTVKKVLPVLMERLVKSATVSYLKDKGSAYRYSQDYKLQVELLKSIGPICYFLELGEKDFMPVIDTVFSYLSDKQPQELQAAAVEFFKLMATYDPDTVKKKIALVSEVIDEEYKKNVEIIKVIIEEIKS